ncbi:hypothetical protein [Nocardia brasiliensis]|uniref:Uncharacterized protein n=1 Tax=Nocardia brasiliensis (strain ATCC 700358 / HUJEG-1) TaxID=1133849 RepID=K0F130_NOCB7|nr:hypothetical protein [Nocardia brasiliensis]AFU02795.1 hypothetical protein O3I_024200 [Nocardia brasiliensis ATCC 700358]OCF85518.1 hypothetical protein AW168_35245 [Nocardia brasiliensis]
MATFTVIGLLISKQLRLAAVIPGTPTFDGPHPDAVDSQPWYCVVQAPSVGHAEAAARFLYNHNIVLDTVTACGLTLDSVVVDTCGTARPVIALRRDCQEVEVWFETALAIPIDPDRPDLAFDLHADVLVLPPGAEIPAIS